MAKPPTAPPKTTPPVTDEIAPLIAQRARQFLVHSFIYYRLGESILGDERFDRLAGELHALRRDHPDIEMPYGSIIDPLLGPEASAFQLSRYPPEIVTAAFKVLYAHGQRDVAFEEFTARRGYRVAPPEE